MNYYKLHEIGSNMYEAFIRTDVGLEELEVLLEEFFHNGGKNNYYLDGSDLVVFLEEKGYEAEEVRKPMHVHWMKDERPQD